MQRYFVPANQFQANQVVILGDDARQLNRVLRAEVGFEMIVSNGTDRDVLATITQLSKEQVTANIIEELPRHNDPTIQVSIAQSLPKADKMETVIQKCTELGAVRFIPFSSKRTVVQYDQKKEHKRIERWQKIVKEAAEQSHRNRLPEVVYPLTWKQLLKQISSYDLALICYEKMDGSVSLKSALQSPLLEGIGEGNQEPRRILILIGPEGGFTEDEVAEARKLGCQVTTLGRRILRTETAALAALTCILYEYNEMEG